MIIKKIIQQYFKGLRAQVLFYPLMVVKNNKPPPPPPVAQNKKGGIKRKASDSSENVKQPAAKKGRKR